jgi:hypothetical protein
MFSETRVIEVLKLLLLCVDRLYRLGSTTIRSTSTPERRGAPSSKAPATYVTDSEKNHVKNKKTKKTDIRQEA